MPTSDHNQPEPPDLSAFDRGRVFLGDLSGEFVDIGWTDTDGVEYVAGHLSVDGLAAEAQRLNNEVTARSNARAIADRQVGLAHAAARRYVDARARQSMARAAQASDGADDVLDRVDAAAEGLCACGCRAPITAESPSAYYASAGCQRRWMAGQVDNPQEVYNRRDAADYPIVDSGVQTLNEPARAPDTPVAVAAARATAAAWTPQSWALVREQARRYPRYRERRLMYGPGEFPTYLAYRRACPACDTLMEPRIYEVDDDHDEVRTFGQPSPVYVYNRPAWEQRCSNCDTAMVGTVHIPAIRPAENPPGWTFELHTTYGRVRSTITMLALDRLDDDARAAHVADTWASMERDLARFEREWRGRLTGDRPMPMYMAADMVPPDVMTGLEWQQLFRNIPLA